MVVSMKNKGRTLFAVGTKHVQLCTVTNIFQEDTWIFAASDLAVVGIGILVSRDVFVDFERSSP
jgi:hypothetical protein